MKVLFFLTLPVVLVGCPKRRVVAPNTIFDGCVGVVDLEYRDISFVTWDCSNGLHLKSTSFRDHLGNALLKDAPEDAQ